MMAPPEMNPLLQVHHLLVDHLLSDPQYHLMLAVVLLDPLWQQTEIDPDEWDSDDDLDYALSIIRQVFPSVYADVINAWYHGSSPDALERLICESVTAAGIPLESLEQMRGGIPLEAYGTDFFDPDFAESHPDVMDILSWFDVDSSTSDSETLVRGCQIGRMLMSSLCQHSDKRYQRVGWAIGWIWSCTGNSMVDLTYEALWDIGPLDWNLDDVAFGKVMIAEAETIMKDVAQGLFSLQSQPVIAAAVCGNIRQIRKHLKKGKQTHERAVVRLDWPELEPGIDGAAIVDAPVL